MDDVSAESVVVSGITDQEWGVLCEWKIGFNRMQTEMTVREYIQSRGFETFEEILFKLHFFLEAIRTAGELVLKCE